MERERQQNDRTLVDGAGEWLRKHYAVQLTITPAVLNRAQGGELYYFCHIHTRMSGRM